MSGIPDPVAMADLKESVLDPYKMSGIPDADGYVRWTVAVLEPYEISGVPDGFPNPRRS